MLTLGKETKIAANAIVELIFTSTDNCIGCSGYNLNDRNLAGKIEITGFGATHDGSGIRIYGKNVSSSPATIPSSAYVTALVIEASSETKSFAINFSFNSVEG